MSSEVERLLRERVKRLPKNHPDSPTFAIPDLNPKSNGNGLPWYIDEESLLAALFPPAEGETVDIRSALDAATLPTDAALDALDNGRKPWFGLRGAYAIDGEAIAKVWLTKRLSKMARNQGRLDGALFVEHVMWDRDSESATIFAKDLLDQLFAPERGTP